MKATVKDVMTAPVVTVTRGTTYKDVAAMLRQHRVSAFPVVDSGGTVIGVVSEADLLAKEALSGEQAGLIAGLLHREERDKAAGLTAGDLMSRTVVTVGPDDPVDHAARLMYTLRVKRLPVVGSGGELLGIVSRTDVLAVFDRTDDDIRADVIDTMMRHEFLLDPRQFTVTVEDGVVTLEGRPETVALGHALIRKTEDIPGVVAVRDRFVDPDTYPGGAGPVF